MILNAHEVRNEDMRYLYCSDPRVQREVRAANRRCKANGKTDPARPCTDPVEIITRREVVAWPQS
jgi:hypothetical protein